MKQGESIAFCSLRKGWKTRSEYIDETLRADGDASIAQCLYRSKIRGIEQYRMAMLCAHAIYGVITWWSWLTLIHFSSPTAIDTLEGVISVTTLASLQNSHLYLFNLIIYFEIFNEHWLWY